MIRIIITFAAILALISGCTKKRPSINKQGQIKDLNLISEIDGKEFELQTFEQVDRAENTTSQKLTLESDVEGFNDFGFVRYTTNADLLGEDLRFRGKENSKYKIKYVLRPDKHLLVVVKIADKSIIPSDEYPYSLEDIAGKNEMAIPIIGYKVKGYYTIEKARNSDNEQTSTNVEIYHPNAEGATHIKFDRLNIVPFEPTISTDLYPAKYFTGDWYFASTLVGTEENESGGLGFEMSLDSDFSPATRIKFLPNRDFLIGVNLNVDERVANDEINLPKVIQLKVDWMDENVMNVPTASILSPKQQKIFWTAKSKKYIKLDFQQAVTARELIENSSADYLVGFKDKKLVDLRFAKDYFSFTIYNPLREQRVKHAFYRVGKRNFKGKKYPENDFDKFGFFTGRKSQIKNHELARRKDYFQNTFLSRFNKNKGEIVYYMTNTSPKEDWLVDMSEKAIDVWDKAFKEAGTGITVRLDKSKQVELGDIRYNSINLIKSYVRSSLLGFGPSLVDPLSGEIVSATANLHVTSTLAGNTAEIRAFIKSELGYYTKSISALNFQNKIKRFSSAPSLDVFNSVSSESLPMLVVDENNAFKFLELSELVGNSSEQGDWMLSEKARRISDEIQKRDNLGAVRSAREMFQRRYSNNYLSDLTYFDSLREYNEKKALRIGGGVLHSRVEKECPAVISLIEKAKVNPEILTTKIENRVVEPCAEKLASGELLFALVHELGHNFGLRHNFYGSSDPKNFHSREDIERIYGDTLSDDFPMANSSSVMDYVSPERHGYVIYPGPYDIAAIRYGYADAVKTKSGRLARINNGQGLEQIFKKLGNDAESYKFCTDSWARGQKIDPMCELFDYGTSPEDSVENLINDYYQSVVTMNNRFDRIGIYNSFEIATYRAKMYLSKLRRFYDQWRFLIREFQPSNKTYFEGMTVEEHTAFINELKKSPKWEDELKPYYIARNRIFDFFTEIAFMPNQSCVVSNSDDGIEIVELDLIRREFRSRSINVGIGHCDDPAALEYFSTRDMELVKEAGFPIGDMRHSLLDKDINDPIDVAGFGWEKKLVIGIMGVRSVGSKIHLDRNFFPNMFDEPDFRLDFENKIYSRVLLGADFTSHVKDQLKIEKALIQPQFDLEREVLTNQMRTFRKSLSVPGKKFASEKRRERHSAIVTRNPSIAKGYPHKYPMSMGIIIAQDEWVWAVQMINAVKSLDKQTELANSIPVGHEIDYDKVQKVVTALEAKVKEMGLPFTPTKANELFGVLGNAISAKEIGEAERFFIETLLAPEKMIIDKTLIRYANEITEENLGGKDAEKISRLQANLDMMRDVDLAPTYAENFPGLSAPNAENGFQTRVEAIRKNTRPLSDNLRREMEAQKELLINILTVL